MFPSVTVRWNMLASAHFNHTERTTETKKKEKLYKDSQVKNQRYRIYSTASSFHL